MKRRVLTQKREQAILRLARTFRTAYAEWRKLSTQDRAAVSLMAGLYVGRIKP